MAVKTVLITGGAGFIGQSLARALAPKYNVILFDNFAHDQPEPDFCKVVRGDVLNLDELKTAAILADVIVHAAAIAGVTTDDGPSHYDVIETNTIGTYNVTQVFSPRKTRQIVLLSTSEVYGPVAQNVTEAEIHPAASSERRWAYAASKLASEHFVLGWARARRTIATIVRPFNIYGPGQIGKGAVNNFVRAALTNEPLTVRNEGDQVRAWCYIDDFTEALKRLIDYGSSPIAFGAFNIGNPNAVTTTLDLANQVVTLADSQSSVRCVQSDFPDVWARIPNIDKLSKLFKFQPSVGLEEGITNTIAWQREYSTHAAV